jgi:hypothetical protein
MSRFAVCCAAVLAIVSQCPAVLAADCFVDSVGGNDSNNGSSEGTAWKSLSKIASSCTTVKFKRGSVFNIPTGGKNYAVNLTGTQIKVLTNYGDATQPLPKFIKPHEPSSGAVFSSYSQITLDGLYIAGSRSDAQMSSLADGICVMIGGGTAAQPSVVKNCEISLCDIGMMTSGDYVEVANNYVHDLSISVDAPPGVDPNAVGGAEGIFVNSSHVRVHHNKFVNCSTAAQWVSNTNGGGVRCDGGATEVTVPNGKNGAAGEVTDVEIDHNFSYNSCGFFEVSSMFQSGSTYTKGKFTNSVFHDNVMVDSGWISLLQINNTKLTNVRWENNTIVHHDMGTSKAADGTSINLNDFGSSAIQAIAFNSTSSGATGGGELSQGDVYWTNNLWYFDPKVKPYNLVDATHAGTDQFLKNIVVTGDVVVTSDPGFIDITSKSDPKAYDLMPDSMAIDKGIKDESVTQYAKTDFNDRPRPAGAGFDLGAFEYQPNAGGSTSTPATSGTPSTGGQSTAASSAVGGQTPSSSATSASPAAGGSGASNPAGSGTTPASTNTAVPTDDGGCSCSLPGNAGRGSGAAWVLALGACLVGMRRRIQHAGSTRTPQSSG